MRRALLQATAVVALLLLAGTGAGCSNNKKQAASLPLAQASAEQLYLRGMELLGERELRKAIGVLERIEYETDSEMRQKIEPLARLALADATFYQGNDLGWIDARGLYLNFIALYGNHPLAPYAQTQAGLCSLKQVAHPSRDQSQTLQAISDLNVVIGRYPDSYFATAAQIMKQTAQGNLAESEFLVGRFYMKRKAYQASAERFRFLLKIYPEFHEREKVEFYLGKVLVLDGIDDEGRLILERLIASNPEGPHATSARKLLESLPEAAAPGSLRSAN